MVQSPSAPSNDLVIDLFGDREEVRVLGRSVHRSGSREEYRGELIAISCRRYLIQVIVTPGPLEVPILHEIS